MSFPRYDKYKDSGVEWLGEVPACWKVRRLKFLSDIQTGDKDTVDAEEDGEFPFFVRSQTVERISTQTFDCEAILTAGDGVGVGKVFHYHDGPFDFHQRVYMMNNFRDVEGRFLFHYLRSNFYKVALEGGAKSTVDSIRRPMLTDFPVSFPPTQDEQKAISSFLDVETSKIDGLVSEQLRLIELLKEKRQAVISHSVTKGMNSNAPMKSSGIQWLGDVPEHWEVKPVRYACDIHNTLRIPIDKQTRSDLEGDYPYYGPTGVLSWINRFVVDGEYFLVGEDGDHFLKFRTQPMTVNIDGQFNVNNHAHLIRGKGDCSTKWASLYFEHKDLMPWLIKQGVGRYKLRKEKLVTIPILVPPPYEQDGILMKANRVKAATTSLIAEAERAIELLQERRIALISAAVTGKLDVRQFPPKEEAA